MVKISCPACAWESQDLPQEFADALGEQLAIHRQVTHPINAAASVPQKIKLDPPKIGLEYNQEQWSSFERQWGMYKLGMAIPENMVNTALFYCCSDELRADILRDIHEDLSTKSEDELLTAIKCLAVKERGILAQRLELGKMTQAPGAGIRYFLAGLRG